MVAVVIMLIRLVTSSVLMMMMLVVQPVLLEAARVGVDDGSVKDGAEEKDLDVGQQPVDVITVAVPFEPI